MREINWYLAYIHLVASISMFFFHNRVSVPLKIGDEWILDCNLCVLNGVFLLLTSVAHLLYAVTDVLDVDRKLPCSMEYRWLEYGISAPIMFVIIAILSGVTDMLTLTALFGLISVTMRFGRLQDQSGPYRRWADAPFWAGFIPYTFAWGIVFTQFYRTIKKQNTEEPVPDFVYPILFITFMFFSSFAIVQGYYTLYKWDLYAQDMKLHLLSLTSKLVLAFWVLGGISNYQN